MDSYALSAMIYPLQENTHETEAECDHYRILRTRNRAVASDYSGLIEKELTSRLSDVNQLLLWSRKWSLKTVKSLLN